MPKRSYSVHERALHSLLMLSESDLRRALIALEWITQDPDAATRHTIMDRGQRAIRVSHFGGLLFYFNVAASGAHIRILEIRTSNRGTPPD